MRAIEISQPGGPEVLKLTANRGIPDPRAGEVRIKVAAAGLNRADLLQRRGLYPAPPGASDIPGLEVAGIVDALGPDVSAFKPGDKVCALLPGGGYAQYAIAHAALCAVVPDGISMIEAAALPESLFTVWNNVFLRGKLIAGENSLIHGGTSGIGSMAIQMAAAFGANVYATTSTTDKKRFCKEWGAHLAISRSDEDYVAVLKKEVPGGIHLVLDLAGGETLTRDFEIMGTDGRHVSIAHLENKHATIDISVMMKKRLVLTGSTLRGRPLEEQAAIARDLQKNVWPLVAKNRLKPLIDKTFPLEAVVESHHYMESGSHIGKIVLTM